MRTDECTEEGALSHEDVPMPTATLDPEGRVLSCNRTMLELAGFAGESPGKMPPQPGLIPPQGPAGPKHFSTELVTRGGRTVAVTAFVRRIDDARGNPCRFVVAVLDAATIRSIGETGLVRAEQTASLVASVVDEVISPVFATDERSRIVYANEIARRLFGRPGENVTGMDLWDAYPLSHNDLFYRIYQRALHEGRPLSADHYSGRLNVWYEARLYPRKEGGLVVVMNNVTARKQYERFMGLAAYTVNRLRDYVFWLDARGRITKANDIANKELRFPDNPGALVSFSTVADFTPEAWGEIWKEVKDKGPVTLQLRLFGRDGNRIPVEASVSYVLYVGQEHGVVIARDISDRITAEQEIKRSQEQAELYLDLMSHDIRNINQIGAGFIELALSDEALSEGERELLKKPLEAFQRSTELIGNVRKLQKASGALSIEEIDLANLLRDVVAHYSEVQGRDVSIKLRAGDGCRVVANPLLKEVFANIVGNAIKHSRDRIDVWITLRKAIVADKPCCEVIIEDNGPGIPDEVKARLFSVKKLREKGVRHRGLGLILAKTLLDDFNGAIGVEDRVKGDCGQGTRFVVTLPSADGEGAGSIQERLGQ